MAHSFSCATCDYDLRMHVAEQVCPECRTVVPYSRAVDGQFRYEYREINRILFAGLPALFLLTILCLDAIAPFVTIVWATVLIVAIIRLPETLTTPWRRRWILRRAIAFALAAAFGFAVSVMVL